MCGQPLLLPTLRLFTRCLFFSFFFLNSLPLSLTHALTHTLSFSYTYTLARTHIHARAHTHTHTHSPVTPAPSLRANSQRIIRHASTSTATPPSFR